MKHTHKISKKTTIDTFLIGIANHANDTDHKNVNN